jgi:hypothetical protein
MSLWCKSLKWFFALLWYIFLDQSLQFSNTLNLPSYNKIVPMHAKDVSNVGQICGLVGRKREFWLWVLETYMESCPVSRIR